ncbi:hypothetical protein J0X14_07040 [Muricauda sp. CAU 1633]|uniref:hypothetical protein n=1 Tax=Allomuricauda sp. CAU 1633 TaxID=2816036 RepID=UPI001A8E3199|nr:hypothetical protein [Muricauda sp. CAU 1633]MBO0322046.1 hypothetical protein [Muricauda sp. CAU 1633]
MARDLRKLFEKEREEKTYSMKKGHEARFLSKLDEKMPLEEPPVKKKGYSVWWQMAASVVVALGLTFYYFSSQEEEGGSTDTQLVDTQKEEGGNQGISLGDLSPDLKKVENYYLTNINLELSDLEVDANNKEVMDSYMDRLSELDTEYQRLNKELNEMGPNDQTIGALVKNLQLRLQLLQKLKSKLNQLKSSKNEQETSNII